MGEITLTIARLFEMDPKHHSNSPCTGASITMTQLDLGQHTQPMSIAPQSRSSLDLGHITWTIQVHLR